MFVFIPGYAPGRKAAGRAFCFDDGLRAGAGARGAPAAGGLVGGPGQPVMVAETVWLQGPGSSRLLTQRMT